MPAPKPTPRTLDRGGEIAASTADAGDLSAAVAPVLRYDYSLIPEAQRDQVQAAAVEIVRHGRQAQQSLIEVGKRLIEVKDVLDHGQFSDWCETEFQMSPRTVQNMMNVARAFDGKSETVSLLTDSALYLLAAPSTPAAAREAVIEQAQATGQSPTKAEVKEVIAAHKPAPTYAAVWEIKRVVSSVIGSLAPHRDPAKLTLSHAGELHKDARKPGSVLMREMEDALDKEGIEFRRQELVQAMHEVADEIEQRIRANQDPIQPVQRHGDQPAARIHYVAADEWTPPADDLPVRQVERRPEPSVVPSGAAHSRQMGAALGKCSVCGRPLSDPVHAAQGCGPVCSARRAGNFVSAHAEDESDETANTTDAPIGSPASLLAAWARRCHDNTQRRLDALAGQLAELVDTLGEYEALTGDYAGAADLRAAAAGPLALLNALLNGGKVETTAEQEC